MDFYRIYYFIIFYYFQIKKYAYFSMYKIKSHIHTNNQIITKNTATVLIIKKQTFRFNIYTI